MVKKRPLHAIYERYLTVLVTTITNPTRPNQTERGRVPTEHQMWLLEARASTRDTRRSYVCVTHGVKH